MSVAPKIVAILATLAAANPAAAQLNEKDRLLANNMSHEHETCSIYFGFVSECVSKRDIALGKQYQSLQDEAMARAMKYGQIANILPQTMVARKEIAIREMKKSIASDCSNISILSNRHAMSCKLLMENPDAYANRFLSQ